MPPPRRGVGRETTLSGARRSRCQPGCMSMRVAAPHLDRTVPLCYHSTPHTTDLPGASSSVARSALLVVGDTGGLTCRRGEQLRRSNLAQKRVGTSSHLHWLGCGAGWRGRLSRAASAPARGVRRIDISDRRTGGIVFVLVVISSVAWIKSTADAPRDTIFVKGLTKQCDEFVRGAASR